MAYATFKLKSLYLNLETNTLLINDKEIPLQSITDFVLKTTDLGWSLEAKRDVIMEISEKHF